MTPQHTDAGGKVGTALASIGSFVAGYIQSDLIFNELVRLFSSCMIAALGAAIGYYVTKWLKSKERNWNEVQPPINPGAQPHKMSNRIRKATARRNFAKPRPTDEK